MNAAVDLDLARLVNLPGLVFHANVFQIHGHGLTREHIGNLMSVSSIESLSSTRLYEAWLEQKLMGDKVSIRAGQLAADTEFATSKYTDVFVNSTYGWPVIAAINLPSGGPSPPLAAVGARIRAELGDKVTALFAVFNGDPAGPGPGDPQARNRSGLHFRTSDATLMIAEGQYAYGQDKEAGLLPGTIKAGGWRHTGRFDDQRLADNGVSQADPAASSSAAQRRSNFGVYAVAEQLLMRFEADDDKRGVGTFARVSASPGDRNLIDFYAEGGITLTGVFAARPKDRIGAGFAFARISEGARDLDGDYRALTSSARPVRDHETLLTLGYLTELRTGWVVQPTLQYIVNPGGGYVLDSGTPTAVRNSTVAGVRTVLKF